MVARKETRKKLPDQNTYGVVHWEEPGTEGWKLGREKIGIGSLGRLGLEGKGNVTGSWGRAIRSQWLVGRLSLHEEPEEDWELLWGWEDKSDEEPGCEERTGLAGQ